MTSYFERFCLVRDNLQGTQVSSRKPLPIDRREVNFYEFIIYLYIQLVVQPSFGYSFSKGVKWPTTVAESSPVQASPRVHLTSSGGMHPPLSARDRDPMSARKGLRSKRHHVDAPSPRHPHSARSEPISEKPERAVDKVIDASSKDTSSGDSPQLTPHGASKQSPRMPTSPRGATPSPPPRSPKNTDASKRKATVGSSTSNLSASQSVTSPKSDSPAFEALRQHRMSPSAISIPLTHQLQFVQEHLGYILRLLCADDPACNVKRSELEPLNFLLAVAQSFYAVHDLNLVDILPKASTTDRYSRIDLAEWINLRLRINHYLYSNNPSELRLEGLETVLSSYPSKNLVKRPISVVGIHQQTILRTDPESIISRNSPSDVSVPVDSTVDGRYARIKNCNSSFIYLLCPISSMKIENCTDSIVVIGAVSSLISVENCKDTTIITACKSIQISNCERCTFYLMTSTQPLILANNYDLQFGPYCTHYRSLDRHVAEAGLDVSYNLWNQPVLYLVELLKDYQPSVIAVGSSRHPIKAAISKLEKQAYSLVAPDNFSPFRIPFELHGPTKQIPFPLPSDYQLALEDHTEEAILLKKELDRLIQDKKRQAQVQSAVRSHFEKWLAETGALQQIEDLVKLQIQ